MDNIQKMEQKLEKIDQQEDEELEAEIQIE